MGSEHSGEKRRLHIVLSLDNPSQRDTWLILSQAKNKTSAVCEAVCGYHKQKNLEEMLRSVLQDELKHISIAPISQAMESDEKSCGDIDAAVLDFLLNLQDE